MKRAITSSLLTAAILFIAASTPAWAQNEGANLTARGHKLPMKWGLGFTIYNQNQPYDIVTLEVPLAGLDIGAAEGLEIQNNTDSYHLKFDYWVLPFLNIYLLGGQIDGNRRLADPSLGRHHCDQAAQVLLGLCFGRDGEARAAQGHRPAQPD